MLDRLSLFILLWVAVLGTEAQNCNLSVSGNIYDDATGKALSYVNVFIQEIPNGSISDADGNFKITEICKGEYHLIFSHIGCEPIKVHFKLNRDTIINIGMSHSPTSIGTVIIKGDKFKGLDQPKLSVNRQTIEDNTNQTLSAILENETGVNLIKNGSGISKPVVHGLYGNRLVILNNGIVQSGQQWGNDHSPEIDPFAADNIIVLKGASAIEFGGGNLGSVILVEPKSIEKEPHLHGQVNYIFESNGLGHSINTRLEKYSPTLAWRINGTFKRYGDRKTATYFLNNTGIQEANFALQLEKSWNDKLFVDFYASTFNSQLGILRGSQIGNVTDLNQALVKEIPFYTESEFSYDIDAPMQRVSHHLAKTKGKYIINERQIIELILAGQLNIRKEFDVRRSGRTEIPALSLNQFTFNSSLNYSNKINKHWRLKLGNQTISTVNTNNPETGILPLIPDYSSFKSGLFSTISKRKNRLDFSFGIRIDHEVQNVLAISRTTPRQILRFNNTFTNVSSLLALKYKLTSTQTIGLNTGYATRNPAINELYSNGLHQGVSGIEEGDINLNSEKIVKTTLEYKWFPSANFSIEALIYHQKFTDYIYLSPQDQVRLTIRGAFPVFTYEQTDANISGLDISSQFSLGNSVLGTVKYSYIYGRDISNNQPLVYMPPVNLYGSLKYRTKNSIKLSENAKMEDTEIEADSRLVFEQKNLLPEQDFVAPPESYHLIGIKISTNIILSNHKIRSFIKVNNLLNTSYRDYLNRQRYFADDLGRSIIWGINFKF